RGHDARSLGIAVRGRSHPPRCRTNAGRRLQNGRPRRTTYHAANGRRRDESFGIEAKTTKYTNDTKGTQARLTPARYHHPAFSFLSCLSWSSNLRAFHLQHPPLHANALAGRKTTQRPR